MERTPRTFRSWRIHSISHRLVVPVQKPGTNYPSFQALTDTTSLIAKSPCNVVQWSALNITRHWPGCVLSSIPRKKKHHKAFVQIPCVSQLSDIIANIWDYTLIKDKKNFVAHSFGGFGPWPIGLWLLGPCWVSPSWRSVWWRKPSPHGWKWKRERGRDQSPAVPSRACPQWPKISH